MLGRGSTINKFDEWCIIGCHAKDVKDVKMFKTLYPVSITALKDSNVEFYKLSSRDHCQIIRSIVVFKINQKLTELLIV